MTPLKRKLHATLSDALVDNALVHCESGFNQ